MSVAVIIPVLGRPANAQQVVDSIWAASSPEVRILFVCSPGDEAQITAVAATGVALWVAPWDPGPGDYARKINLGFRMTEDEFVFLGADDLKFHPGWDVAAVACAAAKDVSVVGTNDLGNPAVKMGRHSTHSLVRRSYIVEHGGSWGEPGFVYHEGYDHQCVDNELVAAARDRDEWAFCWDAVVEHLHPLWGKSVSDATYEKALANGRADIRLFNERRKMT
jgi:hypothetical protein